MSEVLPPEPKPTLHEIAAMPYPASEIAMRKHYVHDWHVPVPEGMDAKATFIVALEYEVSERHTTTLEIQAWSESEAKDLARDELGSRYRDAWDFDVTSIDAKIAEGSQ